MPAAPSPYAGPHHAYHPHLVGWGAKVYARVATRTPYQHHISCFIPKDGGGAGLTTCGETGTHQTLGEKSGRPTIRTTVYSFIPRTHARAPANPRLPASPCATRERGCQTHGTSRSEPQQRYTGSSPRGTLWCQI